MILHTEAEASDWLAKRQDVPRGTLAGLERFEVLLREENTRQNLVSAASLESLRLRHVTDSVQLVDLAPPAPLRWLDLGSGAGFPGLMVGLFSRHELTLVESRALRFEFLSRAVAALAMGERVAVVGSPIERVEPSPFDVISARAFAPLPRLLALAHPFSTEKTRWVLPKGRSAQTELEQIRDAWQGDFRLVPSLTDPDARIIVAEGVRQRAAPSRQRSRA
jgi:16S rRNA (guanine527-N7)-methyltransferase